MKRAIGLNLLAFWLGCLAACGPSEEGGRLAMHIYYTPVDAGDLRVDPPPNGQAPADISAYRICVSAADMSKPTCKNFNRADNPTGAKVGDLSIGPNRKVTFQGYDSANGYEVRWCGERAGIPIEKDKTTQVSMYISSCSNFTLVRNGMNIPRAMHTATLLPDGRVLVIGGFTSVGSAESCTGGLCQTLTATSKIDIYDPTTGAFEGQAGIDLARPRAMHSATLLADGRVLVAGGTGRALWRVQFDNGPQPLLEVDTLAVDDLAGSTAELLDLAASTSTEINLAPANPRALHTAASLGADVLLLGGLVPSTNTALATAARFLGANQEWQEPLDSVLSAPRQGMVLLPQADGRLLVWGGNHSSGASAGEFAVLLDDQDGALVPTQPQFVANEQNTLGLPAFYAAGDLLDDDMVLVSGGLIVDTDYNPTLVDRPLVLNTIRVIDLSVGSERFVEISEEKMTLPRALHTATRLNRGELAGQVLLAGGLWVFDFPNRRFQPSERAEFFSMAAGKSSELQINGRSVALAEARAGHTATVLADGSVLLAGGFTFSSNTFAVADSAELFNPAPRVLRVE